MCIFVLKPPRERPSFSSSWPLFFHQQHVGGHESRCRRRNEPPSLAFLVCLPQLVGFLRLGSKSQLFATDKTELQRFATFHNALVGLTTVPQFLISTGCH